MQGLYELGSTFKIFAVAQAMEAGLLTPDTLVDTKGPMRWGRFTIKDFHNYGPRLSVSDVIVKSSNIGAAHIGLSIGAERQQDFLRSLGLHGRAADRDHRGGRAPSRCCRRAGRS